MIRLRTYEDFLINVKHFYIPPEHLTRNAVKNGLNWLEKSVNEHYKKGLPYPYLNLSLDIYTGISLEWSLGELKDLPIQLPKYQICLDVNLISKLSHWYVLNVETEIIDHKEFNLSKVSSWNQLSSLIEDHNE